MPAAQQTMDLASLTRPAILNQCLRCSSSLAVLENEWAKLSNTYSMPAGWQSVNLQRISVSSDRRQIPQTSDMIILRGRIIQEVSCKLCRQKLGVACMLDNGPNVIWKMTKISFREIVTMKTAEPIFTESALERQRLIPKDPYHREHSTPGRDAALVPSGTDNLTSLAPSMQQEMHHQGRSIDQISTSVNNLQDTMTDLKLSFNALRIELNGPTHYMGDSRLGNEPGIDMIATVLKELKSKSEEIEKLKLEIEALKFKNRFMEDRKLGSPENLSVMDDAVPVRSPESVQAGRKRAWPDAFPSGHVHSVPDSLGGEDDEEDDLSIGDLPSRADTFLIKDAPRPSDAAQQRARSITPNPRTDPNLEGRDLQLDQSPAKRLRLGNGSTSSEPRPSEKRRPGRPRKSVSHSANTQNLNTAPAPAAEAPNANDGVFRKSTFGQSHEANKEDMRTRRRSRSRRSFPAESKVGSDTNDTNGRDQNKNGEKQINGKSDSLDDKDSLSTETEEDMRKAKIAARDTMTRIAMQHEEAMEAD